MNKESILKIFVTIGLLLVVAAGISYTMLRGDKNIQMTQPGVVVPPETARVYTEEEKTKILQDLAHRMPSPVTSLAKEPNTSLQVSSSTPALSAKETQKRIQELKRVNTSVSITTMSDAEKLRILNSLSSKVQ